MRHRFITHKRGGLHWIVGTRLVSEFDSPRRPQDIEKPPDYNLLDRRLRPLYVLTPGGPRYQGRSQEELDEDARIDKAREAKRYLKTTDWYVIRELETGRPIPDEVREQRRLSREAI